MMEDVQDLLKEHNILVSFDDKYVLDEELNAFNFLKTFAQKQSRFSFLKDTVTL